MGKMPGMPMLLLGSMLLLEAAATATPALVLKSSGAAAGRRFVTLGYVFAPGDIPAGKSLSASLAAPAAHGASENVPIQVDAKATHSDGSMRHAVLTLESASSAGVEQSITLAPSAAAPGASILPAALMATPYDAAATLEESGAVYSASARAALQSAMDAGKVQAWLAGPLVSEWLVAAPFRKATGESHPHLTARFAIRAYAGMAAVRTDLTVENGWAFEPQPRGFAYSITVAVNGEPVYAKTGLKHTHHARWRKVFWSGGPLGLEAVPDREYWFSTRSLPNYDRSIKVSEAALAGMAPAFEPMSNGNWTAAMPGTGAHDDIGPLPRSAALYLISQDPRARENVLANGAAGGSYQIHFRDKAKDLPVSIDDYPYMTRLGNPGDTRNPATGKYESFPEVTDGLEAYEPDDAHQPSIAYLPYMMTGDHFFLEEMMFWAGWNLLSGNPGYRDGKKGLLKWAQVRGQAWAMRSLGEAAYLVPDAHPLKAYFIEKLRNNLAWYTERYTGAGAAAVNALGWLDAGGAIAYSPNGIAPWQDDFFTWTLGHLAALGFAEARPLMQWKGRFVTGRMMDPGFCWTNAAAYSLQVGTADAKTTYATFGELFRANFPDGVAACSGRLMTGYPDSPTGYPSNLQPALAAAVDAGVPHAAEAWARYLTREPKQDYTQSPQWAVIPGVPGGSGIRAMAEFPGRKRKAGMELRNRPAGAAFQRDGSGSVRYDALGGLRRENAGER